MQAVDGEEDAEVTLIGQGRRQVMCWMAWACDSPGNDVRWMDVRLRALAAGEVDDDPSVGAVAATRTNTASNKTHAAIRNRPMMSKAVKPTALVSGVGDARREWAIAVLCCSRGV